MLVIKITLMLSLGIIYYQDVKEREVYWFLFPLLALCVGLLFFFKTLAELFLTSIIINLLFISILILSIYTYTVFKLKTKFQNVFGLGDVLLFIAMTMSFSTISFIIIFCSALIFSLLLHLVTKNKNESVPLAGYMSLFFGFIYLGYWSGFIQSVYYI